MIVKAPRWHCVLFFCTKIQNQKFNWYPHWSQIDIFTDPIRIFRFWTNFLDHSKNHYYSEEKTTINDVIWGKGSFFHRFVIIIDGFPFPRAWTPSEAYNRRTSMVWSSSIEFIWFLREGSDELDWSECSDNQSSYRARDFTKGKPVDGYFLFYCFDHQCDVFDTRGVMKQSLIGGYAAAASGKTTTIGLQNALVVYSQYAYEGPSK